MFSVYICIIVFICSFNVLDLSVIFGFDLSLFLFVVIVFHIVLMCLFSIQVNGAQVLTAIVASAHGFKADNHFAQRFQGCIDTALSS